MKVEKNNTVLPQNVPANEFLNFEGKKFSKSRNWGIDVDEFLNLFEPIYDVIHLLQICPKLVIQTFIGKNFN